MYIQIQFLLRIAVDVDISSKDDLCPPRIYREVEDGYDIAVVKLGRKAYFPTPGFDDQNIKTSGGSRPQSSVGESMMAGRYHPS